jgi:putative ABC transport system permease protein
MFKNYFTSALRYIGRNKFFTAINIMGLAIGITACMLITQYVLHEFSYDNFNIKKDRIFRVQLDRYNKGEIATQWAAGAAGIGPDLKNNFPEVERYVRLMRRECLLAYDDVFFKEENVSFASEEFFRMFSIQLIEGVDSLVLKEPFKIVLSQRLARKYFGNENPIGKILKANGKTDYQVTGVFEDLPNNTHMKIDALMSFESLKKLWNDPIESWQWDGFMTYIELNDKTDYKAFESKLPAFVQKREGEKLKQFNANMVFHLQPLASIHLDSNFMYEFQPNGNRESTYFLSIVAVLILVIAWINYVNLSTAKSIERAREVGVRKVMGSFRTQLVQQFLFESFLLNSVAVVLALLFVTLLTPWFGQLAGRDLDYLLFRQSAFWIWTFALIIAGALFSGLYPAFVLSGFKPVEVLKGRFKNTGRGVYFRKGMVVIQFMASITLIIGTYTVHHQIKFMRDQKLGVDVNQTLVIFSPNIVDSTYEVKFSVLKEKLKQHSEVVAVSASTTVPGEQPGWNAGGIRRLSQREDESNQYRVIMMDHDFIKSYGLELQSGRVFSGEVANEHENVLLNESATKQMGFAKPEDALNEDIYFWGDTFKIVGVLKNYHQESLKKNFEPLVFRYNKAPGGYYSIKFNTAKIQESMTKFKDDWDAVFSGNPFISFFLDDHYNQQYQADQQFGKIFGVFSGLAIFIACLGLFGLSSLTAIQRTKEIGVRKVLGASVGGIVALVGKDYIILMAAAIVVATPIAAWIMNSWLQSFAYRIDLSWWLIAIPSLCVIFVALATVSLHTLKAARTNPARSLRYE